MPALCLCLESCTGHSLDAGSRVRVTAHEERCCQEMSRSSHATHMRAKDFGESQVRFLTNMSDEQWKQGNFRGVGTRSTSTSGPSKYCSSIRVCAVADSIAGLLVEPCVPASPGRCDNACTAPSLASSERLPVGSATPLLRCNLPSWLHFRPPSSASTLT